MKADHKHIWGADRVTMLTLSGIKFNSNDFYCIECGEKPNNIVKRRLLKSNDYPTNNRYFIVDRVENFRHYGRYVDEHKFTTALNKRQANTEKGNK